MLFFYSNFIIVFINKNRNIVRVETYGIYDELNHKMIEK